MENFKSFVAIDFETLQAVATDGKIAEALRKGKQIMNVNELKEILCAFDVYEGELE